MDILPEQDLQGPCREISLLVIQVYCSYKMTAINAIKNIKIVKYYNIY